VGRASDELLQAIFDPHAPALIKPTTLPKAALVLSTSKKSDSYQKSDESDAILGHSSSFTYFYL
jgi:hypothetical protein